jgi:CubicO group peptidase (beta-lactamase class C family)
MRTDRFATPLGTMFFAVASGVWAASTEPIRNSHVSDTVNPPDTVHPIFYPLSANAGALETVAPETLLRQFMNRHTATDYAGAAEMALRLVAAIPDRPEGHYNLACVMARLHRLDEAFDALETAVDKGWRDAKHLSMDLDLESLRGHDRYKQICADLDARLQSERIEPTALRTEAPELVAADLMLQTPELIKRYRLPGAQVALVRDGEVVWSGAFGVGDRRSSAPLNAEDRFRVRAPLHLLAILAAAEQQDRGGASLAKLLQDAIELQMPSQPVARDVQARPASGPARVLNIRRNQRGCASYVRAPSYSRNSVFGFLRTSIELASDKSFAEHCAAHILTPLDMTRTSFNASQADEAPAVVGHGVLGSPMAPDPASDELVAGGSLETTAADLGLLLAQVMSSPRSKSNSATAGTFKDAVRLVSEINHLMPGGLGLSLAATQTSYGVRCQVADSTAGVGCLMRWHDQTATGVVILYNSATGSQAAERIAQLALGGE